MQRVGDRLENVSELSELDFTFTVLDSEIVNAFALPGGYVYVSRGLLALAEDEAELAGVIGHEIGHVTARHSAARQTAGGLLTGGLGVLGTLAGAYLGGEQGAQLLGQLGQQAGYRPHPDLLAQPGVRGRQAGRALSRPRRLRHDGHGGLPRGAADQRRAAGEEGRHQRSSAAPSTISSPAIPTRRTASTRLVELAIAQGGTGGERDPDALLDAIDGMIYGPSPAQGFVMGQRFAHPELRLAFTYPDGYELSNQPQAVIGRGDNQLLIFDIGEAEGGGPRQYLENVWLPKADMQNVRTFRTAGGLDAAVGYAQVQLSGRPAEGGFVVLQGQGKTVYRFALLTGRFGDAQERDLMATADSFERLTAAEAAELKPQRVRLVTVREGDTVDTFARQMAVDALPRETFITLNGLDRGQILAAGERVKIVVRD